jgi:hypothetical protein
MKEVNDMLDAEILAPLRQEPPGLPHIDVPRAMAEGARRRRRRQWTAGAATAAAIVLVIAGGTLAATTVNHRPAPKPVATVPVPTSCTVQTLETGGQQTSLSAVDPSGHYILASQSPDGYTHPVVFKDGILVSGPTGPSGTFTAINSHGVAVGTGIVNHKDVPYVRRDGRTTELAGGVASAMAINDSGMIAGVVGEKGLDSVPVRWPSADAAPEKLTVPPGTRWATAGGITEDGTVWGQVNTGATGSGAIWLPDGTLRLLTLTPQAGERMREFSILNVFGGWVYGTVSSIKTDGWPGADYRARYNIAQNRYERLPAVEGSAGEQAENGWIAGIVTDPKTHASHPVVFAGPAVVRLPELKDRSATRYEAGAISRDGHVIVGSALLKNGKKLEVIPVIWNCR